MFRSRSRITRVAIALSSCATISQFAGADPAPSLPNVFCFRFTDIERVPAAPDGNFRFEFEVLNWTNAPSSGVFMTQNIGTIPVNGVRPFITATSVDADGRGGLLGGAHIGPGVFDNPAIQSGRGRGDVAGLLNDWVAPLPPNVRTARWNAGTPIPQRDLFGAGTLAVNLVPGTGVDRTGDLAIDGGPGPYVPAAPPNGGGPPLPDGSGNVLDGLVMDISDFDVGETLSFNWFLLDANGQPLGQVNSGNTMGFGVVNLIRVPVGGPLPGGLFMGNTGFLQNNTVFYDNVWNVPNPAQFGLEFGGGLTAPFWDDADNIFNVDINTDFPEPSSGAVAAVGLMIAMSRARRLVSR